MRHDAISCWVTDHIISKKKCTVTHEQKVWVDHDKANQKPDLFLPDTNQAVDIGVVQPAAMSSYYRSKIEAHGAPSRSYSGLTVPSTRRRRSTSGT